MHKMSESASANNLAYEVARIGYRMLEFLSYCGYSARFDHAGHDERGDYAYFDIKASSLPKVALRHPPNSQLTTLMERCLCRKIAIANDHEGLRYIVALANKQEAVSETV
jgi:hypothetical protein